MKAIIGGKKYDTETATQVASDYGGGLGRSDFGYWQEALYRTKTGAYFLHGQGGGLSQWAEHTPHGSGWGARIEPRTEAEARVWMERHVSTDAYEAEFGAVAEA